MGLQYLTFMERDLEMQKKLTSVQLMNSASLNSKNIMNNVGVANDISVINSMYMEYYWDEHCLVQIFLGWTIVRAHRAGSITPSKFLGLA